MSQAEGSLARPRAHWRDSFIHISFQNVAIRLPEKQTSQLAR